MSPDSLAGGFEKAAVAEPILALVAFTVVVVAIVAVKWGLPLIKEIRLARISSDRSLKEKELEIERLRIESDREAARALDERERERIKATQANTEVQRQGNLMLDGMQKSLDASTAHTDVLVTELRGSRERSHEMGTHVLAIKAMNEHVRDTTDHTAEQVDDIYRHIFREGTD